jgi:hypothetical protein
VTGIYVGSRRLPGDEPLHVRHKIRPIIDKVFLFDGGARRRPMDKGATWARSS